MMDSYGHDADSKTEYELGLSVDDILREYQDGPAGPPAEQTPAPPPEELDEEGVRVYQPGRTSSPERDRPAPRREKAPKRGGLLSGFDRKSAGKRRPRPGRGVWDAEEPEDEAPEPETEPVRPYPPEPEKEPEAPAPPEEEAPLPETFDFRDFTRIFSQPPADGTQPAPQEAPPAPENAPPAPPATDGTADFDARFHIRGLQREHREPLPEPEEESGYLPADEALAAAYSAQKEQRREKNPLRRVLNRGKGGSPPPPPQETVPPEDDPFSSIFFTDYSVSPGTHAPDLDYDQAAEPEESEHKPAPHPRRSSGLRETLAGYAASVLLRLRPASGSGATVEEDEEDLGAELPPMRAFKYYGSFIHTLRFRFRVALILELILLYISLGLPLPGMLRSAQVAAALCAATQLTQMLLGLDVLSGALMNLVRRRFGLDALVLCLCLLTTADALGVATGSFGSVHMPLCAVSGLSMTGLLLSALLNARGLRKALRVPAIGKQVFPVTGERGVYGSGLTLLKAQRSPKGFVRRTEEAGPDEVLFNRISLFLLAAAFLLSLIASIAGHSAEDALYNFSAVLCPAVPVTGLLSFSLPFLTGSLRMYSAGAAIAGWSGLCEVGQSQDLIVTDGDLFPKASISLEAVRIFAAEDPERIITYAGTLIIASGCGLSDCFAQLMDRYGLSTCHVENFEVLPGGGLQGVIDGSTVLCGGSDLMSLMNVRIPTSIVDKTAVLLAIDGMLYGIFQVRYEADPKIRRALVRLIRSNRHAVFAIRDFNVTPEMLSRLYDLSTDGYDFPPYAERFSITQATSSEDSKVAAVVCREDLSSMTVMADTGRSMYVATRTNILLTLLSIALGMGAVFIKLLAGGSFGVGVGFLFAYAIAWLLPVAALSVFLRF